MTEREAIADPGRWLVETAQAVNQVCHEAVDDFSPAGQVRWERAQAARDELTDLIFERVYGSRLSAALTGNVIEVDFETQRKMRVVPLDQRLGGFESHRDGLD